MKYITLALIALVFSYNGIAGNKDITLKTSVNKVSVFMTGAEINRIAKATLYKGRTKVIFSGLSSMIEKESIRASMSNKNVKILSISHEINYMNELKNTARVRLLEDSIKILKNKVDKFNIDKAAYLEEKKMIIKNNDLKGERGVLVLELQKAADFFRYRLKDVNRRIVDIKNKENPVNNRLAILRKQLNEFNAKKNVPTYEINITLSTKVQTNAAIEIRYLVRGAGWAPKYDLRVEDVNSNVELEYRAQVINKTGIDWKHVKLTLSTADPTRSAEKPNMRTWVLNYDRTTTYSQGLLNTMARPAAQQYAQLKFKKNVLLEGEEFTEIEVSALSVDFEIAIPYTIPSDAKPYLVDIQEYSLPAAYEYYSVPKVDRDAFLLAKITDWEKLNLIEGVTNIYYRGTYIGHSYIDTRYSGDTLDLSLGRDKKVIVTRNKLKDFHKKKLIGMNRKETFRYKIAIRNTNSTPIKIELIDQVPVSQEGDLNVEVIDISEAEYNELNGKLTWDMELQPSESKEVFIEFAVKYPKNREVKIRSKSGRRKIAAPRF